MIKIKIILVLSLFLVLGIMTSKAHECPPGSIQIVDLYTCSGGPSSPTCYYYTHYCFECASVEGILTIKSLSWMITANPGCFGTAYATCIQNAIDTVTKHMSDPSWWQAYSNQLCFNQFGGARPCTTPPKSKVFTYFPICWSATFVSDNGGTNQYSFNPCLLSKYCVIEWEVCWNPGTNSYSWTLIKRYLEGNGPNCDTLFNPSLLPVIVGQSTLECFKLDTLCK